MDLELQATLFKQYPRFFRRTRQRDSNAPLDHWGIECGDGWYAIITELSRLYEEHINELLESGVAKRSWPRCIQVKEKFGGLRVYVSNAARRPTDLIEATERAESAAISTCEKCGRPGIRQPSGYMRVACDICQKHKAPVMEIDLADHLLRLRRLLATRSF
jgi:hypothetical protein